MISEFMYQALAQENRRMALDFSEHQMQVRQAEMSSSKHQGSKILVKLAKLLILAGESLLSHENRETRRNTFAGASLQKL